MESCCFAVAVASGNGGALNSHNAYRLCHVSKSLAGAPSFPCGVVDKQPAMEKHDYKVSTPVRVFLPRIDAQIWASSTPYSELRVTTGGFIRRGGLIETEHRFPSSSAVNSPPKHSTSALNLKSRLDNKLNSRICHAFT